MSIRLVLAALLGLAVWGFVEALQAQPAVAGSVAAALLGVVGVVWQQRKTEHARLREAHRDRMIPVYDELLLAIWRQAESTEPNEQMVNFMKDLRRRQLLLRASSEMILAFKRWEADTQAAAEEKNHVQMAFAWEELLRAIRRDLGHDDAPLARGDLLRVFMDDLDEHLQEQIDSANS
jgi:hypothetical protein